MSTSTNMAVAQCNAFMNKHVLPNLTEWVKQPLDERLAMNAITSLYHMADHYWVYFNVSDPDRVFNTSSQGVFRQQLAEKNCHFKILRDVAEAHKHAALNRQLRFVSSAGQTCVRFPVYGRRLPYGSGTYAGRPSFNVELDDGSKQDLRYLAEQVLVMWRGMIV